jgi:hypothetical protein
MSKQEKGHEFLKQESRNLWPSLYFPPGEEINPKNETRFWPDRERISLDIIKSASSLRKIPQSIRVTS